MPLPTEPMPADVLAALQQGDKIEAIKRLRRSTGIGLREAKDTIDGHLGGLEQRRVPRAPASALPATVLSALQQGQKIEAIRLLRQQTGLGPKEAKDAVEAIEAEQNRGVGLSPGQVPASRHGALWLAVVFVLAAVIGYFFLR